MTENRRLILTGYVPLGLGLIAGVVSLIFQSWIALGLGAALVVLSCLRLYAASRSKSKSPKMRRLD
jgi:type IV secretory pathway TrbD component